MTHSFDVALACQYGVLEALLIQHIEHWIYKNAANGRHYHDGTHWTYNSVRAFGTLFPYYSQRQIANALKHLEAEGILKTGHYGAKNYDRTTWYAFADNAISIMQKCKIDYAKMFNRLVGNVEPITDINTDINTDIEPGIKKIIDNADNSIPAGARACAQALEIGSDGNWRRSPKARAATAQQIVDQMAAEHLPIAWYDNLFDALCEALAHGIEPAELMAAGEQLDVPEFERWRARAQERADERRELARANDREAYEARRRAWEAGEKTLEELERLKMAYLPGGGTENELQHAARG